MKKLVFALTVILFALAALCSCGKTDAVKNVVNGIKDLGDITATSGDAIASCMDAYAILSPDEQSEVGNYKKLEKAKEEYDEIVAFNERIALILDSANTSFSDDEDFGVSELITDANAIKSEYKKLSRSRKKTVIGYDEIDAAVEKLQEYQQNAQEPAAVYVKAFLELNPGVTVTKVGCIKQIRQQKEYHFYALSYTDGETEKSVYSTARFSGSDLYDTFIARPDIFYADAPASEDCDALANGNCDIDLDALLASIE